MPPNHLLNNLRYAHMSGSQLKSTSVPCAFTLHGSAQSKISEKLFVMINKDGGDNFWILWGDTAVMRGP